LGKIHRGDQFCHSIENVASNVAHLSQDPETGTDECDDFACTPYLTVSVYTVGPTALHRPNLTMNSPPKATGT